MKLIISISLLTICGCYSPSGIYMLNERLQDGNASYSLTVPTAAGRVEIRRVNPTIGFSASATGSGVISSSPTNMPITIQYHSLVPGPTMPAQATNQVLQPKTKK